MKRTVSLIIALSLMLCLCACGDSGSGASGPEATKQAAVQEDTTSYEITDSRARTWTNSIGTVWVQTVVEITNTGTTNLYLSSGSYDLEDASGALVASKTLVSEYPDVLAPGEKGYMYDETTLDGAVDGELTVVPRVDVEEAKVDLIRFNVTDAAISTASYGSLKMIGRVENTSDEEENMIYIVAFLYDADGACIGQMFTILTDALAAGDKIGFEMTGMSLPSDVTADTVADFIVYAYPFQYQF